MMENTVNYTHYRESSLGQALSESIDLLVAEGKLTEEQAVVVLLQFDAEINKALAQQPSRFMNLEGDIASYRNADNTWNWQLTHVKFRIADTEKELTTATYQELDKVNIAATDAFPGRIYSRKRSKVAKTKK